MFTWRDSFITFSIYNSRPDETQTKRNRYETRLILACTVNDNCERRETVINAKLCKKKNY